MTGENYLPVVCPYDNIREARGFGCGDCQEDKFNCLIRGTAKLLKATGNIMDHAHLGEGL